MVEPQIRELLKPRESSERSKLTDFKEYCFKIKDLAVQKYTDNAKYYDEAVFKTVKNELIKELQQLLSPASNQQLKQLRLTS
jgi:hypothetical protein